MIEDIRKIRSFCKTSGQMRAFNRLITTFAANGSWTLNSGGLPEMYRLSGKTYPMLTIVGGRLMGRDDNGPAPSPTLMTEDLSVMGVKSILEKGISKPWPNDALIAEFVSRIPVDTK